MFFQNTGSAFSPQFAAPQTNPFGLSNMGASKPTFADIDSDGDLDAFIGDYKGDTLFFQNTGSASSPQFAAPQTNPFGLSNVGNDSAPTFADIDGDGDLDAFIGNQYGNTLFFQNTGSASSPQFATAQTNPFGLTSVPGIEGNDSTPTFADIDGDGDLDAFIGAQSGDTTYFQNAGSASSPQFAAFQTNPFGLSNVEGGNTSPTFADIDADGDLDAFVGAGDGNTLFFQNTGSASSPQFAAPQTNPFGLSNTGGASAPTFADIDGDGDLDAFIGNEYGNTLFFQNTGSASSPQFAAPQTNPFGLSNVGFASAPTFADIDSDGDLDAFIGDSNGDTAYFQNTGSASSPQFAAPVTNPFGLSNVGNYSAPTFADINGDGDLDAFIGSRPGDINYFRNGNDRIRGRSGDDLLRGGDGFDTLTGGKGDDILVGGQDDDLLNGGRGKDLFVLAANAGTDTVQDFKNGSDHFGLAAGLTFGQLTISQSSSNTLISLTNDGEVLASLTGVNANLIGAADFTVI